MSREEEVRKFVLYRDKDLTREERRQFYLDKLLDENEKNQYNFVPPKKEE